MNPMPVRPSRLALSAALLCLAALAPARAEPLALKTDAGIAAFRDALVAYRGATQVRWIVAARSHAEAEAAIAGLSLALKEADQGLLTRIVAGAFDPTQTPQVREGPIAFVAPAPEAPPAGCSWSVRVTDPALPSLGGAPAQIALAIGDSAPVGPAATFRLDHSGVAQAKLYAFGETRPGAIRDLSAAPDTNIPVAKGGDGETLLLATARRPAPFYENLKAALAPANGERKELGAVQGFNAGGLLASRAIGVGIAAIPNTMIVDKPKSPEPVKAADSGELLETCRYTLTQARG